MRRLFRFNKIYYRLFLFFALLVITSAAVQGCVSLRYYSARYETKIEELDKANLEKIKEELDKSIIRKAHEVYVQVVYSSDIAPDLDYYFSRSRTNLNSRIYSLQSKLKGLVAFYGDAIRSIDLYNKDRQMLVSSDSGLIYFSEDSQRFPLDLHLYGWLKDLPESTAWLPTRRESALFYSFDGTAPSEIASYKVNYPIGSVTPHNKGFIVININGRFISNLLQEMNYSEKSGILLMDRQNKLLGHSDHQVLQLYLEEGIKDSWDFAQADSPERLLEIDSERYIITRLELENGWSLLKMTPTSDYYADVGQVRNNLIILSSLTVLLGLGLAMIFSFRLYQPVKALVENANLIFKRPGDSKEQLDEYEIINDAIRQLAGKVESLEKTLEVNASLLKNNVIQDLVNDQYTSKADLDTALLMAGLDMKKQWFFCLVIQFNRTVLEKLSIENRQFVNLDVISKTEDSFSMDICNCIGTIINRNSVGFVLNCAYPFIPDLEEKIKNLDDYVRSSYGISLAGGISSPVPSGTYLFSQPYKQATDLLLYNYFMVNTRLFSEKIVAMREKSTEIIPHTEVDELYKLMVAGESKPIKNKLAQLVDQMIYGQYPYLHCQQRQLDIMQAISRFAREQGITTKDAAESDTISLFFATDNVVDFYAFAWAIIDKVLRQVEELAAAKTSLLVDKTKQYIDQNLSSTLSLDLISEHLSISSGYLSRLFKSETNMNFVDYVNSRRLASAHELLMETSLTVEEISLRVGFNSTNYFIRRFRRKYGDSPQAYRVKNRLASPM